MLEKGKIALRDASPYNAAITREQFLFYEVGRGNSIDVRFLLFVLGNKSTDCSCPGYYQ